MSLSELSTPKCRSAIASDHGFVEVRAEVQDQLTAEFDAHDKLWSDAVTVAEEALDQANAQIRLQCADLSTL